MGGKMARPVRSNYRSITRLTAEGVHGHGARVYCFVFFVKQSKEQTLHIPTEDPGTAHTWRVPSTHFAILFYLYVSWSGGGLRNDF